MVGPHLNLHGEHGLHQTGRGQQERGVGDTTRGRDDLATAAAQANARVKPERPVRAGYAARTA
jgi:hypothetical protein